MKKIIKHYPMTDRLIVRRGYIPVYTINYPKFMKTCIILTCICNIDLHQEFWDQEQV